MQDQTKRPLVAELDLAIHLAKEAGKRLMAFFQTDLRIDRKDRNEPVTEADRAAEAVILEGLRRNFPKDGILSEEQPDLTTWAEHQRAWLVDPMDGTKDFIAEQNGFSVMIGLLENGRPVLGVVHQPTMGITYAAANGAGARLLRENQVQELTTSKEADPGKARLAASFSNRSKKIDRVKEELGITDELNVGSVGLKIGLVARGERDLYINPDGFCRLWDTCAPEIILTEAGGQISDLFGEPLAYVPEEIRVMRGIVASNGAIHDAVIDRLAPIFR
ncbi:MAG: 3'(2'),5'-bisphosphate nucleotidase CysQ [Pseudomonadota bacterium]